jgi:outer membrane protein assembly factor BamA
MAWFTALAAALSAASAGTWPGALDVRGNLRLGLDEIHAAVDSVVCARADSACIERMCRALADAYWSRGFIEAEVKCEDLRGEGDTLRISVAEGPPATLESVRLEGVDPGDLPAVEPIFDGAVASPLTLGDVEDRIARMLAFYDGRGHPLAKVEPDLTNLGGGKVELVLKAVPGPEAAIGEISLRGVKHTRPSAVQPELGIHTGQAYDGSKIEAAKVNLARLGIFEQVSDPVLEFNIEDTTVAVAFDLVEARTSFLDGVVGYAPGARGARFAGTARLEMANIGGTLRKARVLWARLADDRLSWSLYYREPRIAGWPLAVEGSLASDIVDTSYARRKVALCAVYIGEPGLEIGTGAFLGSAKDRSAAGGEGAFSEKGLSFHFSREGRDRPANPASGTFFQVRHEIESLDYAEERSTDRTLSSLDLGLEVIVPVATRTNLALGSRLMGVVSSSGSVPVSHMIRLGGLASLRGYPEDWFRCEKALRVSAEARRLLGPRSRVHVFFDAATLETAALSLWQSRDLAYGYGIGMMAAAGSTLLKIEVALGRGDTWSDAKLHLGVVQEF